MFSLVGFCKLRIFVPLVLAIGLVGMASPVAAESERDPTNRDPTNAVQVTPTPDPSRAHSSPQINVHPDTGELVIVEGEVRPSQACRVRLSDDDGRTWYQGGDLMPTEHQDCTLPAEYGPYATSAFTDDGTLYVAFVASVHPEQARITTAGHPLPPEHRHVYLARSEDSGRSFETTQVFDASGPEGAQYMNKGPMMAIDPSDSSRVYVGWRQGDFRSDQKLETNVAATEDGGQTFGDPVDISEEAGGDYPALAVTPDGTVHAVYWERTFGRDDEDDSPSEIKYARSTDHGETFEEPRTIDPGNQSTSRPPVMASDPDNGNLYLVWYANQEVMNVDAEDEQRHDVLFRASYDNGDAWEDRVVLNDDLDSNQFEPGITVAPNGRIDVAWYDFRDSSVPPADVSGMSGEDGQSHIYYSHSTDEGETWSPNRKISDRISDRSVGVWGLNIGSKFNVGITATDDRTYFAWQDTRNADPDSQTEDIYMASLPHAEATGSEDASGIVPRLQGAGLALAIGGLLLAGVARRAFRRT